MTHHKLRKRTCPSGHLLDTSNTRITKERRWSKRRQQWVLYFARQCRTCWREVKRLAKRRKNGQSLRGL